MRKLHLGLLGAVLLVMAWSMVQPHDWFTWGLETFPAFIALGVMAYSYRSFPLTDLLYALIAMHCIVLFVGGHYTYAEVPAFNWLRDAWHLSRNHYDRVGHFMQGFVPALVTRELLLRKTNLHSGKWLAAIVVFSCLGISASYELLEWLVAVFTGEAADAFLGTQGDAWDTQKDMGMALLGAISAVTFFGNWHNRQLVKVRG